MTRFEYVTFDCYGTLVDWRTGIADAFVSAAHAAGIEIDAVAALDAYMKLEPDVQADDYRPYRHVLREAARRVAASLGWRIDRDAADFLPQSLADWPVFPDTRRALLRLKDAGCRLGILSNVDRDLLRGTLDRLRIEFDLLVTAEDVRAYKPAHAHFVEARHVVAGGSWLHAAQSYFHDVVPARELGVPVAWINRLGETAGSAEPDRELRDLDGLAAWLA